MNGKVHVNQILCEPLSENWRRLRGWPWYTWLRNITNDVTSFGMGLHEERAAAQNRSFWSLLLSHSTAHSQLCIVFDIGVNIFRATLLLLKCFVTLFCTSPPQCSVVIYCCSCCWWFCVIWCYLQ